MTTLDQTLQVFRALLEAEEPAGIAESDQAVWAYLSSQQGLKAQVGALAVLRQRTTDLNGNTAVLLRLLDNLDLHRERLSEKSV